MELAEILPLVLDTNFGVFEQAITPEERAAADGHYSLASRVLFIL